MTISNMTKSKIFGVIVTLLLLLSLGAYITFNFYGYVFAKTIIGEITDVERVTQPTTVIGSQIPASQLYSFAVAIRSKSGEIHTASTEDRQWAVAKKGQCVEAKFFPHAPWQLDKSGTYYGARLLRLFDCPTAP